MQEINLFSILEDLLKRFFSAVPSIVGAILVAIVGYLIAKAIKKIVLFALHSVGIDKAAEKLNDIDIIRECKIKIVPSLILSKITYYIILLIFLIAATELLQMPAVSKLISDLINYIPNLISAAIVLVIGVLVADGLKNIALTTCKSLGIPSGKIISNFLFYFVFLTAAISALSQAKIDTDFIKSNLSIILAGGVAAFALAYGLASKEAMSNFLATFYLKPKIKEGDYITVLGNTGKIILLDSNSITLETADSKMIIPLGKLATEKIEIHKKA